MKKSNLLNFIDELKGLNPKEYYNWPASVNYALGTGLMLVVFGVGFFLHLMPLKEDLDAEIKREEDLKKQFVEKKGQAINLALYEEQLVNITKDSNDLLKQLPNKSQVEKLLIDINQAAVSRGLQVELFKPNAEKINEFYAELPINLKLKGNYEAIGNFTADISMLSRVVIFKDMEVSTNPKESDVTLSAVLKTFRYLDKEELDEQARLAAEAKKKNRKKKQ